MKEFDSLDATSEWTNFSGRESAAVACEPWRAYCDAVHRRLISRWVGTSRFSSVLKTDLFDESAGAGCYEALASISDGVHGIDISPEIVESAAKANPEMRICVGDIRSLPFPDALFGLVFSNSTIDHFATLEEINKSIAEMARVLAKGGVLILTMDNPWNPVVAIRNRLPQNLTRRAGLIPYFMGRTLSMPEMIQAVESSGLRIAQRRHIQHAPRVAALHLCRLLGKRGFSSRMAVSVMLSMESLAGWPSASLTGHYSAVLAVKVLGGANGFEKSSCPPKVSASGNDDG